MLIPEILFLFLNVGFEHFLSDCIRFPRFDWSSEPICVLHMKTVLVSTNRNPVNVMDFEKICYSTSKMRSRLLERQYLSRSSMLRIYNWLKRLWIRRAKDKGLINQFPFWDAPCILHTGYRGEDGMRIWPYNDLRWLAEEKDSILSSRTSLVYCYVRIRTYSNR